MIGNVAENMYDTFKEAGNDIMTEEQAVELTRMVREWFARIIACDEACKAWDTKNIKRKTVMELVHEVGTIKERLGKQGITGKRSNVAEFTKQALLKCMKDNIKFVPAEQVTTVQRAHFIELPELPEKRRREQGSRSPLCLSLCSVTVRHKDSLPHTSPNTSPASWVFRH